MTTEEQIKEAISISLIQYRNANGITQKQMSATLGIRRYNYARIESRVIRPSLSVLNIICKVIGKSIDEMCAENAHSKNVLK